MARRKQAGDVNKVGVGIIGTGSIADACHAPAVAALDETELVAVLSRDSSRGAEFLERHGASGSARVHTSLANFVTDPSVEAVIVCSPDRLHAQQAGTAIAAGKHVLVEKPMTVDRNDAVTLVEQAQKERVTLATGFHLRSHVGHRALREQILDKEAVGHLRHIRVIWAFPQQDDSNWRAHDELSRWWSLSAVGAHCIDLARWFANNLDEWESFSSVIDRGVWNGPHDETAVVAAKLPGGPTVEVVSSVQFGPYHRIELFGSTGMAICRGTLGREGGGSIDVNGEALPFEAASPFKCQLRDFIACVRSGEPPRATGAVGLRSVQDLLRAYEV